MCDRMTKRRHTSESCIRIGNGETCVFVPSTPPTSPVLKLARRTWETPTWMTQLYPNVYRLQQSGFIALMKDMYKLKDTNPGAAIIMELCVDGSFYEDGVACLENYLESFCMEEEIEKFKAGRYRHTRVLFNDNVENKESSMSRRGSVPYKVTKRTTNKLRRSAKLID